jgi:Icc-related predicted phosphoesterase
MSVSFLCFSDTHERTDDIWVTQKADVLLHAGDFTFKGIPPALQKFNRWLGALDGFKHKIIIPGNHELSFERDWKSAAAYVPAADAILNGETYEVSGLKIYGEPRQPRFFDWAFNVNREQMCYVWDRVPTDTDVLLTHGPPYGVGDLTARGEHVGCKFLREWILEHQPRLVVCGHIHEGYGKYRLGKTVVVNASICNSKYEPTNKPIKVVLK